MRSWEKAHSGQLTRIGQKDIPCHMASCSAIKTEVNKEEEEGTFGVMAIVFPRSHCMC